jgi:hypothetical protein
MLGRIQMIQSRVSLLRLPVGLQPTDLRLPVGLQPTDLLRGEGRDPFPRWAPAFAGVTEFFRFSIGPKSTR